MKSNTKVCLSAETMKELCKDAGYQTISNIQALGAGEFNAVYAFDCEGKPYALKVAPSSNTKVMTYEHDMMASEVYWYEILRTNTDVRVPAVYYTDFSKTKISSSYFIMERLSGKQMDEMDFQAGEMEEATAMLPRMAAQIHRITHTGFGYRQNGYFDTWDQALLSMVNSIVMDAKRMGKSCENGEAVMGYIQKHKAVLQHAPCRMVNFDLWQPNILCNRNPEKIEYQWIDPERSFWGDPVMDFICFETDKPLVEKVTSLKAYNHVAEVPITCTRSEQIRFAFAQAYLGIIMEVERYFRYEPTDEGWIRNDMVCAGLFASAFATLENI